MTLEQLRQFVTVVLEGSINKAAHKMFLSQSTLSRSMQMLESELGQNLMLRTKHGICLTPFGQEFYDHAQILCKEYEKLKDLSIPNTDYAKYNLRISSHSLSFVDYIFIETYKRNKDKNPAFSIVKQDISSSVFEVKNGLADLGITLRSTLAMPYVKNLIKSNDLEYHKVTEIPLIVYLGKNHPLLKTGRDFVTKGDLLKYPFVSGEGNFDLNEILTILDTDQLKKNSILIMDKDAMTGFLDETDGYTFAPDPESYSNIQSPTSPMNKDMKVLKLYNSDYKFELGYFHKKGDVLSKSCLEFIDDLIALFDK